MKNPPISDEELEEIFSELTKLWRQRQIREAVRKDVDDFLIDLEEPEEKEEDKQ
jgi:hypothetical protein